MLLWSVSFSLGVPCLCSHVTLLLSFSHHQGQKVATCLFITCPRSSETRSSCKCSCLLATSSLPKSLWTERPIRANVLVSQKKTPQKIDSREKLKLTERHAHTLLHTGVSNKMVGLRRENEGSVVWEGGHSNCLKSNRPQPPWILHILTDPHIFPFSLHIYPPIPPFKFSSWATQQHPASPPLPILSPPTQQTSSSGWRRCRWNPWA